MNTETKSKDPFISESFISWNDQEEIKEEWDVVRSCAPQEPFYPPMFFQSSATITDHNMGVANRLVLVVWML